MDRLKMFFHWALIGGGLYLAYEIYKGVERVLVVRSSQQGYLLNLENGEATATSTVLKTGYWQNMIAQYKAAMSQSAIRAFFGLS